MNDELRGQLTADWLIPDYAQGALWLQTEWDHIRVEGEHGLFALSSPAPLLTLRWGGIQGPALARLPWKADNLAWDGSVGVGGYVDALHRMQIRNTPVAVLCMGGQPLKPTTTPYPDNRARFHLPYTKPDFHAGLAVELPESMTTWLVVGDTSLMTIAQSAMIHNLRMHLWGRLADGDEGWDDYFALPLVLKGATVFAT